LCSHIIDTTPTVPPTFGHAGGEHDERDLIPQHPINNPLIGGPPCPASLMYWPLDNASVVHLTQRLLKDQARMESAKRYQQALDEMPYRPSDNRSQSARQPGRLGREPAPDSPDWALGGRADEDVSPHTDAAGGLPVPEGVAGEGMGRSQPHHWTGGGATNNGGTVGIQEDAALIRLMQAKSSEAQSILRDVLDQQGRVNNAIELIDEAKSQIRILIGTDEPGETLTALFSALNTAQEDARRLSAVMRESWSAPSSLVTAREKGEDFIARLYS
jgi:hypothetical protein